jgi:3-oxoacyl-[acyl-carrier protein] reductase
MTGRVVFVTGASRGIGRACALAFAASGAQLVLHARTEAHLDEVAAEIAKLGAPAPTRFGYELTDDAAGKAAFAEIFTRHRRLDVLVNNAGTMEPALLGMITDEARRRTLDVNLGAMIANMQAASRLMMRAKTGSIVNMSSIVGRFGFPGQVVYAAAKAGVIGATLSAAKELAPHGIRVNAVAPGYIDTDMNRRHDDAAHADNLARIRMGRMGRSEEVAAVVYFLAGDGAGYVTGQVVGIDGGMSL